MTAIDVVVMAAGKGTRMKSRLPKVLHRLAGRPLLQHVLDAVAALDARRVVVITGNGAAEVELAVALWAQAAGRQLRSLCGRSRNWTGHAVQQAMPSLHDDGTTLILNGDVPLIEPNTLQELVARCGGERLALLGVELPDPTGYGRILREGSQVRAIVEHKDATEAQRRLREVYTGFMAVPNAMLKRWFARSSPTRTRKASTTSPISSSWPWPTRSAWWPSRRRPAAG